MRSYAVFLRTMASALLILKRLSRNLPLEMAVWDVWRHVFWIPLQLWDLDGDGTEDTAVKTTHTYSHSEGVLSFDAVCDVENAVPKAGGGQTWGLMGIPGVSGRYVSKVTVYYNGVKYFNFLDGASFSYNSTGASQPKDQQGINPAVFNLPYGSTGQVAAVAGRSYILRLRGAGCKISKIVINYSKNKPE